MKPFNILAVIVLGFFFHGNIHAAEQVSFSWAFFLKEGPGKLRSLSFESPETVKGGDLLRIYLELHQRSYVYLYLHDARKDIYLVYPPGPRFYGSVLPSWQRSYIPSGRDWFTLDGLAGVERFYLLASNHRLVDLEEMTARFVNDGGATIKSQLLGLLEEKVQNFGKGPGVVADRIPVHHSNNLGNPATVPETEANRISANGDYGVILDLVNQ